MFYYLWYNDKMIKKIAKCTIISSIFALSLWSFCLWQLKWWSWYYGELEGRFPRDSAETNVLECEGSTDLGNCTSIKEDERWRWDTILRRLLRVFGLNTDKYNDLKFKDYVMAILNMALWLVAFIALIMTIYTFYMLLFSDNEAWIKKAKWNLVGIFIALAIIWLAWLIVSFIFWRYEEYRKTKEDVIKDGKVAIVWDKIYDDQIYFTI